MGRAAAHSAQERHLDLRRARAALSARLGRPPTVDELARELDISADQVLDALEAGAAYRATSLDARRAGDEENPSLAERLPGEDVPSHPVELRMLVAQLLESLPEREATIMRLRFWGPHPERDAARPGISQMHVSASCAGASTSYLMLGAEGADPARPAVTPLDGEQVESGDLEQPPHPVGDRAQHQRAVVRLGVRWTATAPRPLESTSRRRRRASPARAGVDQPPAPW